MLVALALASSACTAGESHPPAPSTSSSTSPSTSPTATRSASPTARTSPTAAPVDDPGTSLGTLPSPETALPFDDVRRPVAWLPVLMLRAGDIRMLEGRLTVRGAVPGLEGAQIRCTDGRSTYHSTYTTRNTSPAPAATSTVRVRWLFAAPSDDAYRCGLYGHADKQGRPPAELAVQGPPATRIAVREEALKGALQWPVPHDVGIATGGRARLFRKEIAAVPGSDRMRVQTAVEVTDHYEGRVHAYDAVVALALGVQQLDRAGGSCGRSWSAAVRRRVTRVVHHAKVGAVLDSVPVSAGGDCTRRFAVTAWVTVVSGSPVTVHGPAYSDTTVEML